jgi:hypothetical protein
MSRVLGAGGATAMADAACEDWIERSAGSVLRLENRSQGKRTHRRTCALFPIVSVARLPPVRG